MDNGSASRYRGLGLSDLLDYYNNQYMTMKILEKDKIAYMKIPSFKIEEYSYNTEMTRFFGDIEHYENFIIDIRGNSADMFAYYIKETGLATMGNSTKGEGTGGFGRFTYPLANSDFVVRKSFGYLLKDYKR